MLGRAVKEYQPPPISKADKSLPSSSPSTRIQDLIKSSAPKQIQKSIGGYTQVTNRRLPTQTPFQQSIAQDRKNSSAMAPLPPQAASTVRKRPSSEMSGFAATLSRAGSFQDSSNTIDLTENRQTIGKQPTTHAQFTLHEGDFDNDSDVDFDLEFAHPIPMSAPRLPLHKSSANIQTDTLPSGATPISRPGFIAEPSSAISWSSSPEEHMKDPRDRHFQNENRQVLKSHKPSVQLLSSEPPIDANPRPAKRRTLPWLAPDAANPIEREQGSSANSRHSKSALPWNATASGVKEAQKAHKVLKKSVKANATSVEEAQELISTTRRGKASPIFLSDEQRKVLEMVVQGNKSVFFTGSAGTGKSVLMRSIIADLRKKYSREPDRVAVTASTGLAACNIGGVTLHSFAGIGLGKETIPELCRKISRNQKAKNRWLRTKVLIVDEISMVDGDLFDKLEGIARFLRKNGRPFGGIQLVITGDFFQLPPVPDFGKGKAVKFAFDASTWSTSIHHTIGLTEVFRQRDPEFANMLNEMRLGNISDEIVQAFRRLDRPVHRGNVEPTELFPTRVEVENANTLRMRNLQGKSFVFKAEDSGTMRDIAARDKLLANSMAAQQIELKKGAQVMLIKNIDDNLVNGSIGQVVAFMTEKQFAIMDEHNMEESEVEQVVLDEKSKAKLQMFMSDLGSTSKVYPLVQFQGTDGTSRSLLCQPEDWKIELPNGEIQAQRRQVPLILAWALSIHKAQGQTLDNVVVDLRKVFENGQAYVALSRATSQDGLQVKNFNKKSVMAHPRVGEFYSSLYTVNAALKHPKLHAQTSVVSKEENKKQQISQTTRYDDDEEEAMAMAMYG